MHQTLNMQQFADISEYIPHRPPFLMVGHLLSVTDSTTTSSFAIKGDNLFCADGLFYEGGLIENIAQTVAAGAGYRVRENNQGPAIGMIGAIKKLKIHKRPCVGDLLTTETKLVTEFENALVIEGSILCDNQIIAQCQMNIFIIRVPSAT
jgi:predicted hotdog family 3-hydroxylacyl-ACP dehydratase